MFVFPYHSYFGRLEISINVKLQKAAHFDQSHACLPDLLNFENATLTAASGFLCTFPMSTFHFRFGTSLSRGGSAALSWYPLYRLLFLYHLRGETTQSSCHHPVLHLLLHSTISGHNLTLASALRTSLPLNPDLPICTPPPHHSQTFCTKRSRSDSHHSKHRHCQRFRPASCPIQSDLTSASLWRRSHLFNLALSSVVTR